MEKKTIWDLNRITPDSFKTAPKVPIVMVLDNIRSLSNVGDILRRILVLLLAVWGYAYSCTGATRNFYHLSSSEGLSDILVNTIYKDSKGYVWLGTGVALDRFDGNNIRSYHFPGSKSGPERVNAITEDKVCATQLSTYPRRRRATMRSPHCLLTARHRATAVEL